MSLVVNHLQLRIAETLVSLHLLSSILVVVLVDVCEVGQEVKRQVFANLVEAFFQCRDFFFVK